MTRDADFVSHSGGETAAQSADLVRRLVCWVRGHRRIRVIEKADLIGVSESGPSFKVVAEHSECSRCRRLIDGPEEV